MCVLALAIFVVIRIKDAPKNLGRRSRFFGSHLGPAWFVLFMIFNVVWTLLAFRGASINAQEVGPSGKMRFLEGAFASQWFAKLFEPLGQHTNEILETVLLLLSLAVLLVFTVFVTYSKHLHIFLSIPNVAYARRPRALGGLLPVYSNGKKVDFEDPGDDDLMGVGKIEDFTWKGLLDFGTCTECGRCQSQCPAWNTDKPLSPKILMMTLRDHALAKAPYLLATKGEDGEPTTALTDADKAEAQRPLVGPEGDETASVDEHGARGVGAVPFDMLWSCTTCGACVEQCPVDIEHVDHIVDMRRYQVLMEGAFPEEAGIMLNNVEHAGDPWGLGRSKRLEWAESASSARTARRQSPTTSSTSTGSAAPGRSTTPRCARPAPWRRCSTRPASSSWSSARPRRAPATPPGGWATSSSSRCSPCRTSRRSTPPGPSGSS